ncbi:MULTISPECIES: RNA polymerase sigma factor [Eubacteriales]|uniref:RNA polymerase sigma-70 factor, ECF subfamily n=1 Tax=Bittarella massiliensis (ex Durand et al. 2017) TaxID=1720313 RepID=A0AAQ1RWX8_9FIRM|nr:MULTISPECIES: sigma-70 family RNA polymerase sigma factor [Eubacteriales]ERI97746.1 Sigma-70 region 2 [Clostridium sp. ATCC 29733]MZL69678.1 sigma-70 family RNA polymerase sigma factor [Bittarella massiliensis (ex Durand et al. 2017)]MZL80850.1 sigma-70 family RNA polymerase sigma factor [Bittarella massiliensis (ex Durand et al. 2017)]SHG51862.1 RNA polymerase sigma-70 factor, ECF subfamily [Bittarella massiliensis (ex Durand et al. 2017)]
MKESELVARLQAGDATALKAVVYQYGGYVYTIVKAVLGGRMAEEDVEEVAADAFANLWRVAERLDGRPGGLKAYLAATARNLSRNKLRRFTPGLPLEEGVQDPELDTPAAQLEAREQTQLLREALDELEELDREILVRHYYFYQRVNEIAQLLGLNENTVKSRLLRGRKALQKKLAERGIDHIEAV